MYYFGKREHDNLCKMHVQLDPRNCGSCPQLQCMQDVPTSMDLHAHGWKSKYVSAVIAEGQSPETLAELYAQR